MSNSFIRTAGVVLKREMNSKKINNDNNTTNPFLMTTIKYWLENVNELGYQMTFYQILLSEGYSICHVSKHTPFEQGKDIIATDSQGMARAYQLKGGNITMRDWNDSIKTEVEKLIDLQIIHPSVDKSKKHKSYLVTNGNLDDTVRIEIDNLNSGKWKDSPLKVITGGELLKKLITISSDFAPQEAINYKGFLDLFFYSGQEMIEEQKYSDFILDVLKIDEERLSKAERKRNISVAIVYTGYIISNFQKHNNHIAIIHILTLLCASILALAEKYELEEKYWKESFSLAWGMIRTSGISLQQLIETKGMIESVTSIWDGEIGEYRRYLATSYLLAIKLTEFIEGDAVWDELRDKKFDKELGGTLIIWGESAIFPYICLDIYLNLLGTNTKSKFLKEILERIIKYNGKHGGGELLSPYYNINDFVRARFNMLNEPIDEKFGGRSFFIKPIVDLLARQGAKEILQKYWREITYVDYEYFIPDELWMHFLWRCNREKNRTGESKSEFPKQTQSWKQLTKEAGTIDRAMIPKILQANPQFFPLFLLVFPHRAGLTNYIRYFDEIIDGVKKKAT